MICIQENENTEEAAIQVESETDGEMKATEQNKTAYVKENTAIKSSPLKQQAKPLTTTLPTTIGNKKGGKYIQTKYGEVKMTEDGSKFECKVCQHTFTRIESVHQHMAIHDETLAMKCDLCDEKFAWKSTLRKHRMTVHDGITTELTCTESNCDRVFKSFGHRKV